ncbi:SDR family oxidoreductase [Flagellimonas pelagia]|uniref:SDR family oxidoreductase n=1 Tax=Flagellimonas pelagia TaxID=2306998 RepID=A0A3A1NKF8_9FLAO|nr:SDR family oxidoreductase [Allomuricauda maritima]RIV46466.1 SDR family oxidoreductase [Allomuricauda maritima]TXJ99127.1 SDR family oxidoreductase [Allomuricauda maritima]
MSNRIGVLGCGWLGLPLAQRLVEKGLEVHGTTTSSDKLEALQNLGIVPYHISLSENGIDGDIETFLSHIDILVINVPPKLRQGNAESFIEKMKQLQAQIKKSPVSKILFVSSTAVYGDEDGDVTEASPPNPVTESGKQLLASEQLFQNDSSRLTTILRFGGLIGPNRHPIKQLSGKKDLKNGHHPINLIHLEDCIHMISSIINEGYWGEIFNGVYPLHPSKKDYYSAEAVKRGVAPPEYLDLPVHDTGKRVKSENFLQKGHQFTTSIISSST